MRRFTWSVLALFFAVTFASTDAVAGRIFGDISLDGKPLPAGVKVQVTKAGAKEVVDETTTDKFGSYKLTMKEEGKATLIVVYDKKPLELAVFSNKEATRYDLVVEKKDGKLNLRRK